MLPHILHSPTYTAWTPQDGSSNHQFDRTDLPIRNQGESRKGIEIQEDVWIGCGARILDGVTLGKGAVIGAGAVVNRSIEAYGVAVGVPATVIRKRTGA